MKQRLAEAPPSAILVGARPEERQQRVAMLDPIARRQGQKREQGEALGLEAERFAGGTVPEQLQTSEGDEPEHVQAST
jgi:hypothetical protein